MGRAIHKAVTIAEIVKRRVAGLHQNTSIGSLDILDGRLAEPGETEEGEKPAGLRHVSIINITLSSEPLDTSLPGYQAPLPEDMVQPRPAGPPYVRNYPPRGGYNPRGRGGYRGRGYQGDFAGRRARGRSPYPPRGRGRGRGGYHEHYDPAGYYPAGYVGGPPPYNPRGRGPGPRGRGPRGRGDLGRGGPAPVHAAQYGPPQGYQPHMVSQET